jgi:hypothetical protein
MSLDYPFYQELCRRQHRAAHWWLIGDRLHYLGLLAAILALPGATAAVLAGSRGFGWHWLWLALATLVVGTVVFFISGFVKGHAYTLAMRDGISASAARNGGNGSPPNAA